MAVWKTDKDIARDMDILSGIKSPEEKIKSYSTWGRGQNLNAYGDNTLPESQEKKDVEEFKWFAEEETLGKLPDSIGRGKKLEILKANLYRSKEMEVHEQLREVMCPDYSNSCIEESFKKRLGLKNEHKNLPIEQFQDSEEGKAYNNKVAVHQSESVKPKSTEAARNHEVEVPKLTKSRRKRQYRNAVLESLERMNNLDASVEKAETDFSLSTRTSLFGTKSSNIPPACYVPGKSSVSYSPQKTKNSFEYKESEFPNL